MVQVTTELNMSYMDRAAVGQRLRIDSSVIKLSKNLGFAEAKVCCWDSNEPIATGRHTVMFVGDEDSALQMADSEVSRGADFV